MKINPDIPKMGYVWVYLSKYIDRRKPSLFSRLIVREQGMEGFNEYQSLASHIGVSCGGFLSVEACIPRIKQIDDVTKVYSGRYAILVKPKIQGYDKKRKNIAIKALSKSNLRYGFFSLLWFKLKDIGLFKKKNSLAKVGGFFCSYLADWAINCYFPTFEQRPSENIMPADYLSDKYEIVWEGYL